MLVHHQIHRDRAQVRTVHGRTVDTGRCGRGADLPAPTRPAMQPMLDDPDLRQRHVPHLAHHDTGRRRITQIGPAPAARRGRWSITSSGSVTIANVKPRQLIPSGHHA